ncbi:MAG TPA: hypothetical protein PKY77_23170 [Phycisphaerae bacterium]|nr:hypothetical protein [Phycisphaerae bacterium]HRY71312.1 hypothetical protein [Phycisphaerae bacterium]HSA29700.1 hypothetical protein [Phycisphaerae bacterium]
MKTSAFLAVLLAGGFALCAQAAEPLRVGSRLELFVDDARIESMNRASLKLHSPPPRELAIVHDHPWEGNVCAYHTVFQDGEVCRMYYRGPHDDEKTSAETHPQVVCYAESRDGIHWTRPDLGIVEFKGSRTNNVVWAGKGCCSVPAWRRASRLRLRRFA